jgi:CBS-domain-containing membrane protein
VLAERLGPHRLLKGIRVKDVVTPICLTVPYFTRLGDLFQKHYFSDRCFCVVVRDESVLGVLSGEDLMSVDRQKHAYDTVEWHMKPLDWVEAVDIADGAGEAIEWIERYRRTFLPVLDGSRLVGIVTKDRIIEEALSRPANADTAAASSRDGEAKIVSFHRCPRNTQLASPFKEN